MFRPALFHLQPYPLSNRSTSDSVWRSRFYYYAMKATMPYLHTALPYPCTLYLQHLAAAYRVAWLLPRELDHLPCFCRGLTR